MVVQNHEPPPAQYSHSHRRVIKQPPHTKKKKKPCLSLIWHISGVSLHSCTQSTTHAGTFFFFFFFLPILLLAKTFVASLCLFRQQQQSLLSHYSTVRPWRCQEQPPFKFSHRCRGCKALKGCRSVIRIPSGKLLLYCWIFCINLFYGGLWGCILLTCCKRRKRFVLKVKRKCNLQSSCRLYIC